MLKKQPRRLKGARNRSGQRTGTSTTSDNESAANVLEDEEELIEAIMTTTVAHQDTPDLHLQDAVVLRLAPTIVARHHDGTPIRTYQEAVQTVDLTIEGGVGRLRAEDLSLARGPSLQSIQDVGNIATMSRPGHGIAGPCQAERHPQCDEGTIEAEDEEVHGVVIELDPLHLQMMPLAHHFPEDLEGGEVLQSPLAAAVLQRGGGVVLPLPQGHVLAH